MIRIVALVLALAAPAGACEISYYSGAPRDGGPRTASGERVGPMTAASRTLRLGSLVRVTTRVGTLILRINDRGPAAWTGRCLDVSVDAARTLGLVRPGHLNAQLEMLR